VTRPAEPAPDTPPLPFVSPIFGDHMVLQRGQAELDLGMVRAGRLSELRIGETSTTVTAGQTASGRREFSLPPLADPTR